jgi:hypothetical protein
MKERKKGIWLGLCIVSIFIAIMIMGYDVATYNPNETSSGKTIVVIQMLNIGIESYRIKTKRLPQPINDNYLYLDNYIDLQGLKKRGLIKDGRFLDGWGMPLKFTIKDNNFRIVSSGKNRRFDKIGSPEDDDIRNYEFHNKSLHRMAEPSCDLENKKK